MRGFPLPAIDALSTHTHYYGTYYHKLETTLNYSKLLSRFEQQQRKQSLQLKPTIVIIDGKLGSRGVAAGILAIHQRVCNL